MSEDRVIPVAPHQRRPLLSLLADQPEVPLSERLRAAQEQFCGMFQSGELDVLPEDTRLLMSALLLFMVGAAQDAFELEMSATAKRVRRAPMPAWLLRFGGRI